MLIPFRPPLQSELSQPELASAPDADVMAQKARKLKSYAKTPAPSLEGNPSAEFQELLEKGSVQVAGWPLDEPLPEPMMSHNVNTASRIDQRATSSQLAGEHSLWVEQFATSAPMSDEPFYNGQFEWGPFPAQDKNADGFLAVIKRILSKCLSIVTFGWLFDLIRGDQSLEADFVGLNPIQVHGNSFPGFEPVGTSSASAQFHDVKSTLGSVWSQGLSRQKEAMSVEGTQAEMLDNLYPSPAGRSMTVNTVSAPEETDPKVLARREWRKRHEERLAQRQGKTIASHTEAVVTPEQKVAVNTPEVAVETVQSVALSKAKVEEVFTQVMTEQLALQNQQAQLKAPESEAEHVMLQPVLYPMVNSDESNYAPDRVKKISEPEKELTVLQSLAQAAREWKSKEVPESHQLKTKNIVMPRFSFELDAEQSVEALREVLKAQQEQAKQEAIEQHIELITAPEVNAAVVSSERQQASVAQDIDNNALEIASFVDELVQKIEYSKDATQGAFVVERVEDAEPKLILSHARPQELTIASVYSDEPIQTQMNPSQQAQPVQERPASAPPVIRQAAQATAPQPVIMGTVHPATTEQVLANVKGAQEFTLQTMLRNNRILASSISNLAAHYFEHAEDDAI